MQFLRKIDMLSPSITFYFKGEQQHSSIISGILSIIVIALVVASAIYYFLGYINKDSPKAYFFTRYIDDAGDFPLNSSSMFNYIQFIDKNDNQKLGFDFHAFIAIGTDHVYYEQYMDDPNYLLNFDYWLYGPCNFDSDVEGITDIVNFTILNNSACIRTFYNKDRNQFYNVGQDGFKWPVVSKGTSNPLSTFYGLIVQRCDYAPKIIKDKFPECKDSAYIDAYISRMSLKYQIVDHYADMLNYKTPFIKYFYEVTSAVSDQQFIVNHLNFNPANMLTHNGILFDNIVEEHSYFFTQNEKHTMDQGVLLQQNRTTHGCLIGVYFWMQNTLQQYERHYDRFQDLLSDIGGISSIITTIAFYLNLLVNPYVTLIDTKDLIISRDQANYGDKKKMKRKPTIFKGINQAENHPPKKQSSSQQKQQKQQKQQRSGEQNLEDYKNDDVNIYKFPLRSKDDGNMNVSHESENINLKNKGKKSLNDEKKLDETNSEAGDNQSNNTYIEENNMEEPQNNKGNKESSSSKKKEFNWCKYIWYLITCGTSNKTIKYYEEIRENLISEENIIQIYLDVYGLLKQKGVPKKDLFINNK